MAACATSRAPSTQCIVPACMHDIMCLLGLPCTSLQSPEAFTATVPCGRILPDVLRMGHIWHCVHCFSEAYAGTHPPHHLLLDQASHLHPPDVHPCMWPGHKCRKGLVTHVSTLQRMHTTCAANESMGHMHIHPPTLFASLPGEGDHRRCICSTDQPFNILIQPLPAILQAGNAHRLTCCSGARQHYTVSSPCSGIRSA